MSQCIDDLSDDDLRAELERRATLKKEKEYAEHSEYRNRVANTLTIEAINSFCPEHERTSCSDEDISNGWGNGNHLPRCSRCALLDTLRTGYIPFPFRFSVNVTSDT